MIIAVVVLGLVVYGAYRLAISADSLLNEPVAPVPAANPRRPDDKHAAGPKPAAVRRRPCPHRPTDRQPPDASPVRSGPMRPPRGRHSGGADAAARRLPRRRPALPQGRTYGRAEHAIRACSCVPRSRRACWWRAPTARSSSTARLEPGDSYRVPDRVGLTLTTPNAGAVQLDLDGQLMGFAGHAEQIAEGAVAGSAGDRGPLQWRTAG